MGHLFETESEFQQWPDLHAAISETRKAYQGTGQIPDFEALAALVARRRQAAS
jgi:hypothetical protein